jgi:hypothetical protein
MTVKFQCVRTLWSYIMLTYFIRYVKKYDDKTFFILTDRRPARVHPLLSTYYICCICVRYSTHYVFPTVSFVCQTSTVVAAVPAVSYYFVYM